MFRFIVRDWYRERKYIRKQNHGFEFIFKYINSNERVSYKGGANNPNVVWQLWNKPKNISESGLNLISRCLDSIDEFIWNDHRRILLNIDQSREYVEFPEFVYEKLKVGDQGFNVTAFSDILRLGLLNLYGGIWVDAAMLALRPLGDLYLQNSEKTGFSFQRSEVEDQKTRESWRHYDPCYFSWNCASHVKWLNSFIVAGKDRSVLAEILRVLLLIWKYEDKYPHYFTCQMIYDFLVNKKHYTAFLSESDVPPHYFQRYAYSEFDYAFYEQIRKLHPLQKMTWKIAKTPAQDTLLYHILEKTTDIRSDVF